MKKNLILFITISLIAVGFVSAFAWPSWSSGKAIDSGKGEITQAREGQITMFEGEIREIEGHVITIMNIGDTSSTIDVDGTSQEINEGSSGTINGFQLTLVNTFESWWRRNNVVLEVTPIGNEIILIPSANHSFNDSINSSIINPFEGEVTYAGILSMLRSAEIVTSEGLMGSQSCDNVCGNTSICIASARGRFEGNFTVAPNYFESTECSALTSAIQFKLYCTCVSLDTSVNQVAGRWGCIECSSPGQCGLYGTCLSSGCCGGTAPQGVTN